MQRKPEDELVGGRDEASPNSDATNLIKRLEDNQPLSDTQQVDDEKMGERRQYGARKLDPERESTNE